MTVIASDFIWAENLDLSPDGKFLYVSDAVTGNVFRYKKNSTTGRYTKKTILDGAMYKSLGVAVNPASPTQLYVVGQLADSKDHVLVSVNTKEVNDFTVTAMVPPSNKGSPGNGLRVHEKSGIVYTAMEGSFIPGKAQVFKINPKNGNVTSIVDDLWAADGVWIDQTKDILYVSQVVKGNIWAYDIANEKTIGLLPQGIKGWLDDFCLDNTDGDYIFASNFLKNSINYFNPNDKQFKVLELVTGIESPTSMRFGYGAANSSFPSTSLFVTEGGGVLPSQGNRRVLELKNAVELVHNMMLSL
jgi:sugar lactone lactonase YvrE